MVNPHHPWPEAAQQHSITHPLKVNGTHPAEDPSATVEDLCASVCFHKPNDVRGFLLQARRVKSTWSCFECEFFCGVGMDNDNYVLFFAHLEDSIRLSRFFFERC